MNNVYEELRFRKTKDIIDKNHNENGWIENEEKKEDISYQKYAFKLNIL